MGNFFARFASGSEIMERPDSLHTPIRPGAIRTLHFDPRSPTSGIDRTPIAVEKTPSRVASCNNLNYAELDSPCSSGSSMSSWSENQPLIRTSSVPDSLHKRAVLQRFQKAIGDNPPQNGIGDGIFNTPNKKAPVKKLSPQESDSTIIVQ